MIRFADHERNWNDCDGCDLCEGRSNVVLYRGKIPCDLFLIGEGPGESEDTLGSPFIGPSGALLDEMIDSAFEIAGEVRVGISNLVACIPRLPVEDSFGRVSLRIAPPSHYHISECAPRLEEMVKIAKPKGIVAVGKLAEKYSDVLRENQVLAHPFLTRFERRYSIDHPAYILRANVLNRGLLTQRAIVTLCNAIREVSGILD